MVHSHPMKSILAPHKQRAHRRLTTSRQDLPEVRPAGSSPIVKGSGMA
jgi:hypothetical protein